jgi:hypothetical protein
MKDLRYFPPILADATAEGTTSDYRTKYSIFER